jgi:hypothetical protein
MRARLSWIGRVLFGAGVAVALALGTAQALASPRTLSCESCVSTPECIDCCRAMDFDFGICPFPGSECLCG